MSGDQVAGPIVIIHDRPRRPNMEYLKACSERQGGAVAHEDIKEVIEYKLVKENKLILRSELVGKEVKVEVTL